MTKPSIAGSGRSYLTVQEIGRLIEAAGVGKHGARNKAMIMLMFYHGLRVSELVGLRRTDLDLDRGMLMVRRLKGSEPSAHPLNGLEMRACKHWLRLRAKSQQPTLFISERRMPFTRYGVANIVQDCGLRAGLPFHVHPHMLRHSCGYALVNDMQGSRDMRLIQAWLGHKNPMHTAHYATLAPGRFAGLWGGT